MEQTEGEFQEDVPEICELGISALRGDQMDPDDSSKNKFFSRLFHRDEALSEDEFEEDLISKIREGHEQGVLSAREVTMIRNIFAFADKDVKDIMQHRSNIVAIDGESTMQEAVEQMIENHYSRYPVYIKNLDNIIGLVHIKDTLRYVAEGHDMSVKLRDLEYMVRRVIFVPQTHSIDTLLAQMQHRKNHMILVQDEYGQTCGLLSMEDVIEEIVGNIQDEYDDEDELVARLGDGAYMMQGPTPLDTVADTLGIDLSDEEAETLNGFLLEKLGRIPQDHESFDVTAKGYHFHVIDVEHMVALGVRISREASLEDGASA